jgi:hypothetical protein
MKERNYLTKYGLPDYYFIIRKSVENPAEERACLYKHMQGEADRWLVNERMNRELRTIREIELHFTDKINVQKL